MNKDNHNRANPYRLGQITLLLGGVSLALATLPQTAIQDTPAHSIEQSSSQASTEETAQTLKRFRVAAMAVAILGICIAPIAWMREKPPLLPATGSALCVLALFWYYIVIAIMMAVGVFVFFGIVWAYFGGLSRP